MEGFSVLSNGASCDRNTIISKSRSNIGIGERGCRIFFGDELADSCLNRLGRAHGFSIGGR